MTTRPHTLGVLDWGIGGLGIVQTLREHGLRAPIVYLSDTGAVPYGKLDRKALSRRVARAAEHLQARGAHQILIACNAASTVIDQLALQLPIHGVIAPTIAALRSVPPMRVGIIGGARTVRSGLHRRALVAAGHRVTQRIAQPLSGHIERGTIESAQGLLDLQRIVLPLRAMDCVVLACTHYPAIRPRIEAVLPGVRVFDPAHAVASSLMPALSSDAHAPGEATTTCLCTGDASAMRAAAIAAWGRDPGVCRAVNLARSITAPSTARPATRVSTRAPRSQARSTRPQQARR